jgi:SWI/SNF-related matrix-associated actin-dependent regulator of chromatin subfamily A member 5
MPEVFENESSFQEYFKIENVHEEHVVSKLHSLLQPFLLRRLKVDVAKDLPPKREIKLYTGMVELQAYWYKSILSRNLDVLNQHLGASVQR